MATQVPYNPVPSASPADRPTPYRQLDVPANAFGAATAQAQQHMGSTLQGVGNEIYARAIAMQELNQQAEANKAVSDFQDQSLQSLVDFHNRMGKDASDHLPEYEQQLEAQRQKVREGLSSPYAQKLYDSESRNSSWRMKLNGAIHAATQLKSYYNASNDAKIESAKNAALANPDNEADFQAGLTQTEQAIRAKADTKMSPEAVDFAVQEAKNQLAQERVKGLARTEGKTASAKAMLDKYTKDGLITGDTTQLQSYIDSKFRTTQSRVDGDKINSGRVGWGYDGKVMELDGAAVIVRGGEGGEHWIGRHPRAPNGGTALGGYGIMDYNLKPWLKEAKMPDMSEDDFIADHDAQTQLFKFKFGQYQQQTGSFEGALHKWFGSGSSDGYHTWEQYRDSAMARISKNASVKELDTTARDYAKATNPSDPTYPDTLSDRVVGLRAHQDRIDNIDAQESKRKAFDKLEPTDDGKLITTLDQALADPETDMLYHRMKEQDRKAFQNQIKANAAQGGFTLTDEKRSKFVNFMGIAQNPDRTPEDMDYLQKYNVEADEMPTPQKNPMLKVQRDLRVAQTKPAESQMARGLKVLGDAGILKEMGYSTKSTNARSNQFRAALHDLIENYIQTNRKPPEDDQIREMGVGLIKKDVQYWSQRNVTPSEFELPVPDEWRDKGIRAFQQQYGREPTPQELQRLYAVRRYIDLYSKPTGPKNVP